MNAPSRAGRARYMRKTFVSFLISLTLYGCASVPPESVSLSAAVGTDLATEAELKEFDELFAKDIENIKGLSGNYASAVQELHRLSSEAQAGGAIRITPPETYSQLIALVQRASAVNLSQAQLKDRIIALGDVAVNVARSVSGLAALFA